MDEFLKRQTVREILELSDHPTLNEIKTNYRRLIKKYHPDVCKEKGAEEFCKRLNMAYEICIGKRPISRQYIPPSQTTIVVHFYGYSGTSTNTSYTWTTGW